ncbi:alpha/beta fold hydrolase [Hymenobacter chitinivorans]|uniref:Pimeloyl-ACP methyl ester carboxylesterase n=1 Tax=Hymenobacter chitinivorans DSM 11115 TaxID=1121954 RepID=A0A2M9BSV3_9BACT|nr:alpha/beta fold hydrolase [Hymenobacter chitinivorans]PJJ61013.1 pimeloyl-ACP methyl ester carboxylesterase [Hymenobacter chitinivorans DSM 11115]
MMPWTTATCPVNGIRLHYTRTGGPKPPVLLLHGLMTSGRCWTELARALAADYDVIMPDARGHGESGVPAAGYRYDDHAADIAGLIRALELPPVFLLGHSMGGMTAAVVASQAPALLRGLVLADPTFLSPAMQQQVYESDVVEQHRRVLELPLEEVLADARRRHPHRPAETLALMARARLQTSPRAFEVLTPPNPDYRQLIGQLSVPGLLVVGEQGVVSGAVAQELQELNPRLRVERIREAGHALHLDQPAPFATVVRAFLDSFGAGAT